MKQVDRHLLLINALEMVLDLAEIAHGDDELADADETKKEADAIKRVEAWLDELRAKTPVKILVDFARDIFNAAGNGEAYTAEELLGDSFADVQNAIGEIENGGAHGQN